jgi:hypothetical protein
VVCLNNVEVVMRKFQVSRVFMYIYQWEQPSNSVRVSNLSRVAGESEMNNVVM